MNDDPLILGTSSNYQFVEELYQTFLQDPDKVDSSWKKYFESFPQKLKKNDHYTNGSNLRVFNLIQAYRFHGHLMAHCNPIETKGIERPKELQLETYGLSKEDLEKNFPSFGFFSEPSTTLKKIIEKLESIYCRLVGFEYMGLEREGLEQWVQNKIEPNFPEELPIEEKKEILNLLNKSELFESFLHTKYVGQKRFSLEGGETLIPMLQAIIDYSSKFGLKELIIGMAHRGRLNVLSNILNKSLSQIFSEFEEHYIPESIECSGDVKYHKGFDSEVKNKQGQKVKIHLASNPSHLEAIDPIVEGRTKARQILERDEEQKLVIPVLIHGDAAISGQGVVYETLQLYNLPGYSTGGTIHIVINNQIGFTTLPNEGRSTRYCTDIAKTFASPVFHVNAEDPESCILITKLAVELRQYFHCDVFIDLNCYRKYGHNETDEPSYTQPLEYQKIRKKIPIREVYFEQLAQRGSLEKNIAIQLEKEFKKSLTDALNLSQENLKKTKPKIQSEKKIPQKTILTGVSKTLLQDIGERLAIIPDGFSVHPKLQKVIEDRVSMIREGENTKPLDWGMAEILAYGSLLWEGIDVRISGQDSQRGTFSHRHGGWVDQEKENKYFPLQHLKENQGRFDLLNSPLSENSVLGFEFGYSLGNCKALVIWEAQFGDFANSAQVVIDQFIATAEQKWALSSGITMLLPHGYEGQGPEHSSARIERFLSLAGDDNMQIVYPTTPAQLFHLIRRQALMPVKKPLIVFTPKALLRYPKCVSHLNELTKGSFQNILEDPTDKKNVQRMIFCTGKVYYDLLNKADSNKEAIIRIEQLYPLDTEELKKIILSYPDCKEYFWAQEEPKNMGAWNYIKTDLQSCLPKGNLQYVGREAKAAPATGSHHLHNMEVKQFMNQLFKEKQNEN